LAALGAAALALISGPVFGEKFSQTMYPLAEQTRLAGALSEVSGLAPAGKASVYAHNDEQGAVFELDVLSGKTLRTLTLGRPAAIDDFEAIAAKDGALSLITSKGIVYEAMLDGRRSALRYRTIDTGVGSACEIEGFARADARDGYFIACKKSGRRLVVYKWSRKAGARRVIDLPLKRVVPNPDEFRASDIVADPAAGTLLVLDSSAGAILEVSLNGEGVDYWRLGGKHPQAEGLTLLGDGKIVVADEGKTGQGSIGGGALTLYPPRR